MTAAATSARRTNQPVRRDSYDVDDPRAQVFRPIADGTQNGALAFIEQYLKTFDEYADFIKSKGKQHELNQNARKVLHRLLTQCMDFKTGICEPALDALMRLTGFARPTVVRALDCLSKHRFVQWVRRTMRTDIAAGEGPQVKQVSNAYFLDLARLPKNVLMSLQQRLRKKKVTVDIDREPRKGIFATRRRRRAETVQQRREDLADALRHAKTEEERAALLYPGDPESAAEHLALLGIGASSGSGLNPPPRTKE